MADEFLVQGVLPQMARPVVEQSQERASGTDQDLVEPRGWALQWDGSVLGEMLAGQNDYALPSAGFTQARVSSWDTQ
jgi:hypothetical protein